MMEKHKHKNNHRKKILKWMKNEEINEKHTLKLAKKYIKK